MTENKSVKQMIGKVFIDIADAIETGQFGAKIKVGLTTLGSEHGVDNLVKGAELAAKTSTDFDIVLIGPKVDTPLEIVEVNNEEEMHKKMEELLDSGYIKACVTMHYNFPIGVSTVGKVITPGMGREMFLATTTGTSSAHRVEAMVKNAIYGIITAKAMGIENPTVGILNLDGARQTEKALKELNANGYPVNFSESMRSDGGAVMRGNDLLAGTVDVMVSDTLTGNIMMKVFSSYTTGGSYEALGYGYGPGVGEDYKRVILILSRASGVPVVANAIKYAAGLAKGDLVEVAAREFKKAREAKLDEILKGLSKDTKKAAQEDEGEITAPPKEVVTGSISGIDIMDLEDAVKALWKAGIYAESGMGCTGPIVMIAEDKLQEAMRVLAKAGFVAQEGGIC
ncbi:glycine/sarcosine/betaine reductase complex component C subunit alpha [Geosporobacter ferrireducens]|uniref:Glycine reductase n=1 Tax=Geosporobacter ferrireducens TaxID=1424294 RepID=A0A1D8GNB8_9FIRM|nr:glycine/sarcosine/betaine reductase complex component C subunit alpha [Geosporobacter ferrireducens]AOT72419.1 glycine reductase [Geosporobacter ferrireducens]MTI56326.1 glycine reductase [Geosporobacter ferrireducens]